MDGMMNPFEKIKIFNGFPNDMMNGNGMGGGSWLVLLFLIILFGGAGMWGNNRGMNGLNTTAAIDEGMILQGIQGNRSAIDQLASNTKLQAQLKTAAAI